MIAFKIVDAENKIDILYLLFYASVFGAIFNPILLMTNALAVSILIVVRDELLRKKRTNEDVFRARIEFLESDISAIKMSQGIKNLR